MSCVSVPVHSPPIRGYLLDGKFFVGAALASTLTKLVFRYIQLVAEEQTRNVSTSNVYCNPSILDRTRRRNSSVCV